MGLDTKTYWLTDRQSQCNFDFDFDLQPSRVVEREESSFGKPTFRDMSLGAEKLNWVESSELAAAE
jgi:hypothetical protein